MEKIKVLVLGANGMAGHVITQYLSTQGYEVHSLTRRPFYLGINHVFNVSNFNLLENLIKEEQFNVVINCIGILNSRAEENKKEAILINALLPHFLVDITKSTTTKIIHLSTDCVFSGEKGEYKENDFKDGKSFYDLTKSLGEIVDNKNLTFRNSIIGPDLSSNGIGLFNWFMKQKKEITGYGSVFWNGVTTITLAKAIKVAIENDLVGLFQLASNPLSKYEMLKLFNQYFRDGKLSVHLDHKIKLNKTLVNTRADFNFVVPSQYAMIQEMKLWIEQHKEQYMHYF